MKGGGGASPRMNLEAQAPRPVLAPQSLVDLTESLSSIKFLRACAKPGGRGRVAPAIACPGRPRKGAPPHAIFRSSNLKGEPPCDPDQLSIGLHSVCCLGRTAPR